MACVFRAGRTLAGDRPPRYGPRRVLLKVRRTLMSIARAVAKSSRSFRTLMFSAAMRVLPIKDLKDLRVFLVGETIDMQVLTDLKRGLSQV